MQTEIKSKLSKNQLAPNCFSDNEITKIREAIHHKYSKVARSASGYFKYTVGKMGALELGYDKVLVERAPEQLLESFCGVGNPFAISPLQAGLNILDIGCGAGFDLFIAANLVGPHGLVVGVDVTQEMINTAESNLKILEKDIWQLHRIDSEKLPFEDEAFDVIISNGVINLSPCKQILFDEIFRVLRPGGRLQFADIIVENELPPELTGNVDSWSE